MEAVEAEEGVGRKGGVRRKHRARHRARDEEDMVVPAAVPAACLAVHRARREAREAERREKVRVLAQQEDLCRGRSRSGCDGTDDMAAAMRCCCV